jgi:chemotaxis protein methyltransferase CheR
MATVLKKQFEFTAADFTTVQKLIHQYAGINLNDHKFEMVYSRLARRLRVLNISTMANYLKLVQSDHTESIHFINAITTNLTYFYRETHHFDYLKQNILPELSLKHKDDKRIRLWSAGCSTGEEAYSIAMSLHSFCLNKKHWDIRVLATDLDTNVLNACEYGEYPTDKLDNVSASEKKHYFNFHQSLATVKPKLKKLIAFKRLNLMEPWPMSKKFDVIFCRNVLIYFDRLTQNKLIQRFARQLLPGGYLILGHTESIGNNIDLFETRGRTIFQKRQQSVEKLSQYFEKGTNKAKRVEQRD